MINSSYPKKYYELLWITIVMAKELSTLVTQKIGSPCSHICVKLCESTLLQGHSHSNHHGQDGGGFSAIFQVGREDQFLRRTSDELFTVLMIFSCYQYCFSFWFRCFRLSWSPTLFTGGHLKKRSRKHSHTYSWLAWNLVTSSTYRGRPPTWESPSMWKTTSGWQCSWGSFNAFLNNIFSAGLSTLAVCGSLRDRLRKNTYSIWGTSSEGAYS